MEWRQRWQVVGAKEWGIARILPRRELSLTIFKWMSSPWSIARVATNSPTWRHPTGSAHSTRAPGSHKSTPWPTSRSSQINSKTKRLRKRCKNQMLIMVLSKEKIARKTPLTLTLLRSLSQPTTTIFPSNKKNSSSSLESMYTIKTTRDLHWQKSHTRKSPNLSKWNKSTRT